MYDCDFLEQLNHIVLKADLDWWFQSGTQDGSPGVR